MPGTGSNAVRFGKESKGGDRTRFIIAGGVSLIVLIIVILVISFGGDETVAADVGCRRDRECGDARICIKGGCLPFLESEHRGLWRDDVGSQLDAGVGWSPRKSFGVKLIPSKHCPAVQKKVETPPLGSMAEVGKVEVFELGKTAVIRHQQVNSRGSVWIDAIRMRFPPLKTPEADRICASESVVAVAVGEDGDGPYIDASLKNASPAGKVATAAVALRLDSPPPDPEGFSTLTFTLAPAFEDSGAFHTVLAVPIGAEVAHIQGATPFQQRLLTGFVTYYFRHTAKRQTVRVRYRTERAVDGTLDITEVNP